MTKTISTDQLVVRKNLSYTINFKNPFSGNIQDNHENGQVSLKGKYEDGLKTGLFLEYYDNGQLKRSSNFFMGTEEGKIEEFYKNGNIKTSYKMTDGKISDGLLKVYDEEGYVEKLEFYKNNEPLDKYESHTFIVQETGKELIEDVWWDKDDSLKLMTIILPQTQKLFSGEYVYIDYNRDGSSLIYTIKDGKFSGKYSEFTYYRKRSYRGETLNGMDHGFYEYINYNEKEIVTSTETGQFKFNKKHGKWVKLENGKRTVTFWNDGTKQE